MLRIGIDTGGTFTDFVIWSEGQFSVLKTPSTPHAPQEALLKGLQQIMGNGEKEGFLLQHGSTVATNALLERKGARTALLTNQGFEDVLEIGRQNRPGLYSLKASRPQALVPPKDRIGVKERISWDGRQLVTLEPKSLDWLRNKIEQLKPQAVAVCLLYAYAYPENENRIREALAASGLPISLSHEILPEFREYERTSATVINAYLTPVMAGYLEALSQDERVQKGRLTIMQSGGGTLSAAAAAKQPVRTLFSGPAGGVTGAFQVARAAGHQRIITFDMGGTSTDVCLCDGAIPLTREAAVDHFPVPIQTIDIHTVGAGGGSVAWMDEGGLLRVGPRSAGADPGPVCYGKGEEVTVTDAHVLAGVLNPDWFLGGELALAADRVRPALEALANLLSQTGERDWSAGEVSEGILQIVNTQMENAIRLISLERGFDTQDFTLVSYGGAGGLHACDLARSLLIPRVLVPAHPGVLSALGILQADVVKDSALTVMLQSTEKGVAERMNESFDNLQTQVQAQLQEEGVPEDTWQFRRSADLRYLGQSYEINVPASAQDDILTGFHQLHLQQYGYSNPKLPVEIVTLRVLGSGRWPAIEPPRFPLEAEAPDQEALIQEKQTLLQGELRPTRFYLRKRLKPGNRIEGPAVVVEYSATTLVAPDFQGRVDEFQNLILEAR